MPRYSVAVIGTGADPENPTSAGFAMGYHHARNYEKLPECEVVACADLVRENAEAFAETFDIPDERVFEDYGRLLETVEPDVVSVTVPPAAHADIVVDCARAGVSAIHCEKPMAATWGGAREMVRECDEHDAYLTFNHQRRFKPSWRVANELLENGRIGDLQRVEMWAPNLFDWGTHCFDMLGKYVDEAAPEWVLAGLDYSEENVFFGAHNENQAVVTWKYENGVDGFAQTGSPDGVVPARLRLLGTKGTIEVDPLDEESELRVRAVDDDGWVEPDLPEWDINERVMRDVIGALETGEQSELCAENARNATELIFGAWESVRTRGRVEFPLEIDDNPLEAMIESGELTPVPSDE
ncbi:Gfo/Idh/MocA family protein [Halosimplex sp. J119]